MFIRFTLVGLALSLATVAAADARFKTVNTTVTNNLSYMVAQNTIDTLPETDRRRMVFYAERAMNSLKDVIDAAGTTDFEAQNKINTEFRSAITRLADAGIRSGMNSDQVADFFAQVIISNYGIEFISKLDNVAGGLDLYTVLRNVSPIPESRASVASSGADYLNSLNQESDGLVLNLSQGESAVVVEQSTTDTDLSQEASGPVPLSNASAAERAVINRVTVNNGVWEIRIIRGDSLALIASALYGDSLSFNIIFQANQDVLNNPNNVGVGQVLRLPQQ